MSQVLRIDIGTQYSGHSCEIEVSSVREALEKGKQILKENKDGLFDEFDSVVRIFGTGAKEGVWYWDEMNGASGEEVE